jgi:hypothetical protein
VLAHQDSIVVSIMRGANRRPANLGHFSKKHLGRRAEQHPRKRMLSGGLMSSGSRLASPRAKTTNSTTKPRKSCKRRWIDVEAVRTSVSLAVSSHGRQKSRV